MEQLLLILTVVACPLGMGALAAGSWVVGRRTALRQDLKPSIGQRVRRVLGGSSGPTEAASPQTFVLADLVGYTALTEAYGDQHAAELAARFHRAVRRLLPAHGAREVKSLGDGLLLRVAAPAHAIHLAIRIVEDVGGREGLPRVRVGVHTGSAVEHEGDWFGGAVNTTARVASQAQGSEVLVTEATRVAAGEPDGYALDDAGERRLRNLSRPVRVHRAGRRGANRDHRIGATQRVAAGLVGAAQ